MIFQKSQAPINKGCSHYDIMNNNNNVNNNNNNDNNKNSHEKEIRDYIFSQCNLFSSIQGLVFWLPIKYLLKLHKKLIVKK